MKKRKPAPQAEPAIGHVETPVEEVSMTNAEVKKVVLKTDDKCEEDLRTLGKGITTLTVTPDDLKMAKLYAIERSEKDCDPRQFALLREEIITEEGAEAYKVMLDFVLLKLKAMEGLK